MGLTTKVISPFGNETAFDRRVPELWLNFNKRRAEIPNRKKSIGFGLAMEFGEENGIEELTYMAAAQVNDSKCIIPRGMRMVTMPPNTYAIFETTGSPDSIHAVFDYIYGVWLPSSGFRRAEDGYDLEIFDARYKIEGDSSFSTFCVPVKKKK
jgi:AraC family transcriptional regulator